METFLIKALQLILSLSILVIVHEFGHFLFARLFKVRVEKFYLFFDPWFSLFKFKPKNSDTEYGIGWLPLGGYCKISGMIDESMDKEQMAEPAKPYEFRSKPAGQRLLIMIGGVLFNFLLALFIYSMILLAWGDSYMPMKNLKMGLSYSEPAKNIGFQDGDLLYKANDDVLERYEQNSIRKVINAKTVTVLRDGVETVIPIPEDMMQRLMREKTYFASADRFPMVISSLYEEESPAKVAGLMANDSIVSFNGVSVPTFVEANEFLDQNKNAEVEVGFYRNGMKQTVVLTTTEEGKLGVYVKSLADFFPLETQTYGFLESFPAGIKLGVNTLKGYVSDMKHVFSKEGATSLGGFGTIGNMFPAKWDWRRFWEQTAFLSIILAFMNILPIPALDGGHVMFLLYEVVTRRKPSDKFLEYAQITGMFLLLGLLLYANGNDILRMFAK
ncbi:RIP metalloprotease RseP [Massilibacteroides sp.]|uniref:RIP metalloprotease RseP n=1 Tax=Massilibacteroides sp. TaxID=2034766 RepID=UPI00262FBF62|nr:RIP metalloprotease RseP [Massilibacteroides sp.]MDD4515517.1 RIP metalloprotease RseP [Massilibacteroides sp.]